jgi:hypothetical protein
VRGAVVSAGHSFTSTKNWDTWSTTSLSVPLKAGTSTIRVTGTTANGGPNIDKITIG